MRPRGGPQSFSPDVVVRLEDPNQDPLIPNSSGGYTYRGFTTTQYQTVLHELGHALGLAHSTDALATMYPTLGPSNTDLDANDITGIKTLYRASTTITPTPTPTPTKTKTSHGHKGEATPAMGGGAMGGGFSTDQILGNTPAFMNGANSDPAGLYSGSDGDGTSGTLLGTFGTGTNGNQTAYQLSCSRSDRMAETA